MSVGTFHTLDAITHNNVHRVLELHDIDCETEGLGGVAEVYVVEEDLERARALLIHDREHLGYRLVLSDGTQGWDQEDELPRPIGRHLPSRSIHHLAASLPSLRPAFERLLEAGGEHLVMEELEIAVRLVRLPDGRVGGGYEVWAICSTPDLTETVWFQTWNGGEDLVVLSGDRLLGR